MTNCLWCGEKLPKQKKSVYCSKSCGSSYYSFRREMELTKQFNKNPNKFVKKMITRVVAPKMLTREEKTQRKIDRKYGVVFEIKDNVEIPRNYKMLTEFYQTIIDKIKQLKPGENFKIEIKESKTSIPSILCNIVQHIKTKIPFKKEIITARRKNNIYIIREKDAKKPDLQRIEKSAS